MALNLHDRVCIAGAVIFGEVVGYDDNRVLVQLDSSSPNEYTWFDKSEVSKWTLTENESGELEASAEWF